MRLKNWSLNSPTFHPYDTMLVQYILALCLSVTILRSIKTADWNRLIFGTEFALHIPTRF